MNPLAKMKSKRLSHGSRLDVREGARPRAPRMGTRRELAERFLPCAGLQEQLIARIRRRPCSESSACLETAMLDPAAAGRSLPALETAAVFPPKSKLNTQPFRFF